MFRTLLGLISLSLLAFAFQDSLSTLQLSRDGFQTSVSSYVERELSGGNTVLSPPNIGSKARPLFLALNDAARSAAVKEIGLAAKLLVMSSGFEGAYKAKLKRDFNAVDHGLNVSDTTAEAETAMKSGNIENMQAKIQAMMRDQLRQMVLDQQKDLASFDAVTLKALAESIEAQMDSIPPTTAAEKAQRAQAGQLLAEAIKLSSSNLPAAREKYRSGSLLAVYINPSATAGAQADDEKKKQQIEYNKRAFRPTLKRKLLAFAAEAKTVDFKAATQPKSGKTVFVNPAYERKSAMWKMLFRLGPGGTNAAVAIAQTWAAEL